MSCKSCLFLFLKNQRGWGGGGWNVIQFGSVTHIYRLRRNQWKISFCVFFTVCITSPRFGNIMVHKCQYKRSEAANQHITIIIIIIIFEVLWQFLNVLFPVPLNWYMYSVFFFFSIRVWIDKKIFCIPFTYII